MKNIYLIPDINNLEKTMELAEKYQAYFEYNDFFLPQVFSDEKEIAYRINIYKSLDRDRSKDMLHGAFLDITIHSQDVKIREISEERVRQSLSIAKELGIRGVVFHANLIAGYYSEAYLDGWFSASVQFWENMLMEYPTLEICVENMFESRTDDLKKLAEAMKEEPRFGICLDYAHTHAFGKDKTNWIEELTPYIHHCHINDNNLQDDLHLSVGNGKIDWNVFSNKMRLNRIQTSVLVEVKELSDWEKSIQYMKKNGVYPYSGKE